MYVAVVRNFNCWDVADRQSNSKCRWQCCKMPTTNIYCCWRWTSHRARDV